MRGHSCKFCLFAAIVLFCTLFAGGLSVAAYAQDSNDTVRGFTIDQRFQGSSSSFGQILKLNTNLSYELGRHVGIDAGVPFYFVNDSPSGTTSSSGFRSGVGNVYTSLRLSFKGALNYKQTIVSKIVEIHTEPQPPMSLPANSRGRGVGLTKPRPDRVFETTREVVGTADLASDHGGSSWIGIGPIRGMDLTVGYSRSKRYGLNTVFWGIGKRFGPFGSRPR